MTGANPRKPKIIAILIAFKAVRTLESFYASFPKGLVDEIILVDDASGDGTYELALRLGITSYENPKNLGYGGNMKRALALALERGADIIIDIHPDGEYKPSAIPLGIKEVERGALLVLGNRFSDSPTAPMKNGMRIWKIIPILILNWIDKIILGLSISDFHQGFRIYTKILLENVNFRENANDYLFSFELIAQAAYQKMKVAEVPVETSYRGKKRGASIKNSILYTLGTFKVLFLFLMAKAGFPTTLFTTSQKLLRN